MTKKMHAVVVEQFGGVEELKVREIDRPEPGEGEVLVRIKAAGINPVDWKIRAGKLAQRGIPHEFPVIIGWDMAGVIEECGFSARRFAPGDEVYAFCRRPVIGRGCYAEYLAIPESYVCRKPRSANFETAAATPLAALTAYQTIHDAAKVRDGERVLIIGASGGVGTCAIQFCRQAGAHVIAVASGRNEGYVQSLGAHDFIDYTKQDFQEALKTLAPKGADFIFDCQGGESLGKAYACVGHGGRLASIVQPPEQAELREPNAHALYVFVEPNSTQLDHIAALIDTGALKIKVSKTWRLQEVQEAHRSIEAGHTTGKMVLLP